MSIVLISSSPSATSRSARLLRHVENRLAGNGESSEWISLRDLPAAPLLRAQPDTQIAAAVESVLAARAVVIASPIYKVAYSGLLKVFLDLLPEKSLDSKFVLPISTAGSPHHLLALDFSIRPVLAALGAREVIAPVCAIDSQVGVSEEGFTLLDPLIESRLNTSLALLLDRVHGDERRVDERSAHYAAPTSSATADLVV